MRPYRPRLSRLFLFSLCLLPVLASPALSQASQPQHPAENFSASPPVLSRTEGAVRILENGSPFPKAPGDLPRILKPGDKVQTTRNAKALILSEKDTIVLDGDSLFTVLDADKASLESGVALFEITARDGRRVTAQTPLVVIGVKGTRFLVSSNEKREDVALLKGSIGVTRQDRQPMALFQAKDPGDMSFADYMELQKKSFGDYKEAMMQDFNDYKATMNAEFLAFKEEIDLAPGRRLTLGTGEKPEAVEAALDKASEEAVKALETFKNQKAARPQGLLPN